ncbi:MAG TPA: S41 family peptidase [Acetobacteraceae bacterium]|nr:S41 family peptidase [Acetobacteraceae bacterium]
MRRIALLLLVLAAVPARAQTAPPEGFDARLAADVYTRALAFMAPRILEPIPVPQLATWGLRGLTALDPELGTAVSGTGLVLNLRDRIVAADPLPANATPEAWGNAAARMAAAAWPVSAAVRRAGTEGIIQSFFDEMFNHLDPYSRYVGPVDAREDREHRGGKAGAGLTLARRGSAIIVIGAIPDGAGADAGLRAGDRILAVDGQSTRGRDAATVSGWMDGPEGTTVEIEWRGRNGGTRRAEMERASVPPETVFAQRYGGLLLLRVTSFSRRTDQRIAAEVERNLAPPAGHGSRPMQGLILDLRGNRGGLLRQAVTVADVLLPEGIVATTAGRDPEASRVWRSTGAEMAPGIPVVVIVDGRTASAAEILAAALADRGRAVVIGSSTLGKGLVQTIDPLPDGGELFVTWSRVLAPRGWPIQGLGVLPQVCTSLGEGELAREMAELDAGRQPMAAALARHERARAPLPVAEILAIRGTCPASEGRESDLATARALIGNPGAYATALLPPLLNLQANPTQP